LGNAEKQRNNQQEKKMKVFQLSDFHFTQTSDKKGLSFLIEKIVHIVKERSRTNEEISFCTCGDITNRGNIDGYPIAEFFFNEIQNQLQDFSVRFEFTPGNHDIVDKGFSSFDHFAEKFTGKPGYSFSTKAIVTREYSDYSLILINSAFHGDYSYGSYNEDELSLEISNAKKPPIFVLHHTLFSRRHDDPSAIRNSYGLIQVLSKTKGIALLHGHTHGYSDVVLGNNCRVIGVGPIFKPETNINNQFNLIDFEFGEVARIENFSFREDLKRFTSEILFENNRPCAFSSETFSSIYPEIIMRAKKDGSINQFSLSIETSPKEFFSDIEKHFPEKISEAKNWLSKDLPEFLYYNHAQYINGGEIDGMTYIVEELNRKPTSSRALLSLINMKDITRSGDYFLPAFDIVQFGFHDDSRKTIQVSIYMRALEVKHFLPINIAEVYILLKKISERFLAAEILRVNLFSFRAQYKETFGCHKKARIDAISEGELMLLISEKKVGEIIEMLQEKIHFSETVVIDSGVKTLERCAKTYVKRFGNSLISESALASIAGLAEHFDQIRKDKSQVSIYSMLKAAESGFIAKLESTISELKRIS